MTSRTVVLSPAADARLTDLWTYLESEFGERSKEDFIERKVEKLEAKVDAYERALLK